MPNEISKRLILFVFYRIYEENYIESPANEEEEIAVEEDSSRVWLQLIGFNCMNFRLLNSLGNAKFFERNAFF